MTVDLFQENGIELPGSQSNAQESPVDLFQEYGITQNAESSIPAIPDIPKTTLEKVINSAPFQFALGGSDEVNNLLRSAINLSTGSKMTYAQSGSGTSYDIGKIGGDIATGALAPEAKAPVMLAEKIGPFLAKYLTSVGSNAALGAGLNVLSPDRQGSASDAATSGAITGGAIAGALYPVAKGLSSLKGLIKGRKSAESPLAVNEPLVMKAKEQQENNINVGNALQEQLADVSGKERAVKAHTRMATSKLNDLVSGLPAGSDRISMLPDAVRAANKSIRNESRQNYSFLKNKDVILSNKNSIDEFPNYAQQAERLLDKQKSLNELFGSDSDLSSSVRDELKKASEVTGLKSEKEMSDIADEYASKYNNSPKIKEAILRELKSGNSSSIRESGPITLNDAFERTKKLGKLAQSAAKKEDNYSAKLLGDLKRGLEEDAKNLLSANGHQDMADQWDYANKFHAENVVPFWSQPEIRRTILNKNYKPKPSEIAKELHHPDVHNILGRLPEDAQNASMFEMLTGGDYDPSGKTGISANKISGNLGEHPERFAMASYNPEASNYFESLPHALEVQKNLTSERKSLEQALSRNSNKKDEFKKALESHQKLKDELSEKGIGIGNIRLPKLKTVITNPAEASTQLAYEFAKLLGSKGKEILNQAMSPEAVSSYSKGAKNLKGKDSAAKAAKIANLLAITISHPRNSNNSGGQ